MPLPAPSPAPTPNPRPLPRGRRVVQGPLLEPEPPSLSSTPPMTLFEARRGRGRGGVLGGRRANGKWRLADGTEHLGRSGGGSRRLVEGVRPLRFYGALSGAISVALSSLDRAPGFGGGAVGGESRTRTRLMRNWSGRAPTEMAAQSPHCLGVSGRTLKKRPARARAGGRAAAARSRSEIGSATRAAHRCTRRGSTAGRRSPP